MGEIESIIQSKYLNTNISDSERALAHGISSFSKI